MTAGQWLFLCGLGCVLVWWVLRIGQRADDASGQASYERIERRAMPTSMAGGTLVLSEEYFTTDVPRRLGARVDQVYVMDGVLVPVETKTRFKREWRHYDQIELSVQAAVLRYGRPAALRKWSVADYGWVRVVWPGRAPKYIPVPLLGDDQLAQLYDAYWTLMQGREEPRGAVRARTCERCAYAVDCPQSRG